MEPFLTTGDRIIVLRWFPDVMLTRNSIVVARVDIGEYIRRVESQEDLDGVIRTVYIVKRLVGMPHELIEFIGDNYQVDRSNISESQVHLSETNELGNEKWEIPARHYFLIGDSQGMDSRELGPIDQTKIVGVMIARINGSTDKLKYIKKYTINNPEAQ